MTNLLLFTAQSFVTGLWQGAILLTGVAAALRLLPRLTPSIRFAVWSITFVAILAVPLLHLPGQSANPSSPTLRLDPGWALASAACWALLLTFRLSRLAIHALHLRRIWHAATPCTVTPQVQSILDSTMRRPALCSSPDVDAPSVIGFFAPRLLMPDTLLSSLTESELHQIVQHECEHLRRRDDWINLLQKLALAFFPLNPALLIVDRRLGLERELACDAAVVHASVNPFAYANSLTRLAEHRILRQPLALALSAWSRQSELARRVYRLLRPTSKMSPCRARCALVFLGLALAGGAFELTRIPNLIAFTPALTAPLGVASELRDPVEHVRAVAVVYHPPIQPLAEPLNLHAKPARAKRRSLKASVPVNREAIARIAQPPLRLMLTSAPVEVPPHIVQAIWTDFSPTYAAMPFAGGWLILQL